jgi:Ca2+-binding EF-hand superfamily protein
MDRYNKLNINSKAEFKKQLVSQKDKSGKGGLSLQEVWRVQEEYLKKMRLKEKDVFLLFKKYEQNGQIVLERFLSDLMMG